MRRSRGRFAARNDAPAAPAAGFVLGQPLPPALLYRHCDPAELPFELCSELEEAPGLIGQDSAVEALNFAVRIQAKGYNVYALGASGTGRHGMVEDLLRQRAATEPTPPDWCYVNNFDDAQLPRRLQLPGGRGAGLAAAMGRLVEELRAALSAAFERDENRARREAVEQQFRQRTEGAFGALQQRAELKNITLLRTPMGLALAPTRDGKVLAPELFNELPTAERESIQHETEAIQAELEAIMRQVPQWEREHRDAVQALNRETAGFAIAHLMEEMRRGYGELPDVTPYLDAVERDIKDNVDDFLTPPAAPEGGPPVPAAMLHGVADPRADPARHQGGAGRAAAALLPAQRPGRGVQRSVQDRRRFRGPRRAHAANHAALCPADLRDDHAREAASARSRRRRPHHRAGGPAGGRFWQAFGERARVRRPAARIRPVCPGRQQGSGRRDGGSGGDRCPIPPRRPHLPAPPGRDRPQDDP